LAWRGGGVVWARAGAAAASARARRSVLEAKRFMRLPGKVTGEGYSKRNRYQGLTVNVGHRVFGGSGEVREIAA
jgi:hypothetical protein